MSTASTQFEDERRLYAVIDKHHREALKREQIRMARGDRPKAVAAIATRAKDSLGNMLITIGVRIRNNPKAITEQGIRGPSIARPE